MRNPAISQYSSTVTECRGKCVIRLSPKAHNTLNGVYLIYTKAERICQTGSRNCLFYRCQVAFAVFTIHMNTLLLWNNPIHKWTFSERSEFTSYVMRETEDAWGKCLYSRPSPCLCVSYVTCWFCKTVASAADVITCQTICVCDFSWV